MSQHPSKRSQNKFSSSESVYNEFRAKKRDKVFTNSGMVIPVTKAENLKEQNKDQESKFQSLRKVPPKENKEVMESHFETESLSVMLKNVETLVPHVLRLYYDLQKIQLNLYQDVGKALRSVTEGIRTAAQQSSTSHIAEFAIETLRCENAGPAVENSLLQTSCKIDPEEILEQSLKAISDIQNNFQNRVCEEIQKGDSAIAEAIKIAEKEWENWKKCVEVLEPLSTKSVPLGGALSTASDS